jgi:hypothetical protein
MKGLSIAAEIGYKKGQYEIYGLFRKPIIQKGCIRKRYTIISSIIT